MPVPLTEEPELETQGGCNGGGDKAGALSDYLVHVRTSVKAVCGPDSSEYEMVGGTRSSDRKKPKKKDKEE